MPIANHFAAWAGILLGSFTGAVQGLCFHREDWLGGYASWPRRMLRLGHISFFGIGFINLAFAISVPALGFDQTPVWPSRLFILALALMPSVCYASAFWKPARHLFFVPVLCVVLGAVVFLLAMVQR